MRFQALVLVAGVLAVAACKGPEEVAPEVAASAKLGEVLAQQYPQSFASWQGYATGIAVEGGEWLQTLNVASGPLVPVTLGDKSYMKGYACKSGETACDTDRVVFFVAPDQSKIFGFAELVLPNGNSVQKMIGAANGEELRCLRFFIEDTTGATSC